MNVLPEFIFSSLERRPKIINGIHLPDADNRGRVFPYNEAGPHFVGPCIVNGQTLVVKMWENHTQQGKKYFRLVFETLEENPHLIT